MKKFSESHEWVEIEGEVASVGISSYAVEQLGDITFMELPDLDMELSKGESAAFVESVKAASDIYTPISGTVIGVNEDLLEAPEALNADAEGTFIFKLKVSDVSELDSMMSQEAYDTYKETL
ncbi:MAG: glycine cleavage system protein GcvH [Sulfurovum sp.]|nr:glycine cleavage system protein GcvH [Sulfurovum sp.]